MIKLNKKEIEYVKKSFIDVIDHIKQLDKEELIKWIEEAGDVLKDIMMVNRATYLYDDINTNEYSNKLIIKAFAKLNVFEYWIDKGFESAEELSEYMSGKELGNIYEKYLKFINKKYKGSDQH